ncbi:MAG TPA: SDR family oxidoreductase [Beutenbergiaceae bacterium]|nr:SDR family oxidoreductase [Beutenbergiaceae bacterium]
MVENTTALRDLSAQQQEWPGRSDLMQPVPDHGETSYSGRERLVGKRALITGGDSGIGRATAIAFAKEGADVAITHLPEEADDAAQTHAQVTATGRQCHAFAADLRTAEDNDEVAERVVAALGGVDVVVANAAYQMAARSLADFPKGQVERTFATNVFSPFWLIEALDEHLRPGSSIIITTSIQAYEPSEPLLDYAASKAALNNLTVNLAGELGPRGIRVNAVAPGPIWTPLIPSTMPAERVDAFGADTPLGRAGQPIEVATAYVYLASDEASYVSGTVLGVTGGRGVF